MTTTTKALPVATLGQSPVRLVLYQHHDITHAELQATLGKSFGELYARIGESGVAPAGPPLVIYHDESEPGVRWNIDVCAPVAAPISAAPGFVFMEMPAGRVVSVMFVGQYEELGAAYDAIERFVEREGLTVSGPPREIYLSEPDVPPDQVRTLVERPVI